MDWVATPWAWIAEHPIIVTIVVVALVAVIGVMWGFRKWKLACESPVRRTQSTLTRTSPGSDEAKAVELAALSSIRPAPPAGIAALRARQAALEIEAGRLAYQIPNRMWLGIQETVEVRLGRPEAQRLMQGFVGRGDVKTENTPIVETMSVSLECEPGAFDIEPRSEKAQLVKPDLVKETAFYQADFAKWVWLVTPRQNGAQTLLVKVSAALKDSRGLPTTAALPDKIIAVTVRVHLVSATVGAAGRAVPWLATTVAGTLVGIFTRDYWWPYVRDFLWPAVRAMVGME